MGGRSLFLEGQNSGQKRPWPSSFWFATLPVALCLQQQLSGTVSQRAGGQSPRAKDGEAERWASLGDGDVLSSWPDTSNRHHLTSCYRRK